MAIVKWTNRRGLRPWSAFGGFERELDRIFGDTLPGEDFVARAWAPAVDVRETEDGYRIEADLPGLSKDDIEVTVENGILTLKGERKEDHESDEGGYHYHERRHGAFHRSFSMPDATDTGKAQAEFKDGVLSVTLPKRAEAKPKRLEVKVK